MIASQVLAGGRPVLRHALRRLHSAYTEAAKNTMKATTFIVKVNRGGTLKTEYVQRIDPTPIQMTSSRKLALVMGTFTAEDAIKSIETTRCIPELVSVSVSA
jgi:hypothetical protein